jgi:hypothetical protein
MRAQEFLTESTGSKFADGILKMTVHANVRSNQRNISMAKIVQALKKLEHTRGDDLRKLPPTAFVVKTDDFEFAMSKSKDIDTKKIEYILTTVAKKLRPAAGQRVVYLEDTHINEINDDDELSVSQRIQDYFTDRGYKYLGEGRDQIAFLSPRNTVLKVVGIGEDEREDIVKTYVGFFLRNQRNPHYPRIYNAGDFAVDGETYFVYEMEYLYPVSGEDRVLEYIEDLMSALPRGEAALAAFYQNKKRPPELSEQQVDGLVFATQDLEDAIGGQAPLDLRSIENLGRRKDGQIVIIDPFSL